MPEFLTRSLTRSVLLAPAALSRAAAAAARAPEERWMLTRPRPVRASYVREVVDRGGDELRQQSWMLRQPDDVRESFIAEVLMRMSPIPREEIWMLRQSPDIRESYVREVLEPGALDEASPEPVAGSA